MQQHLEPIMYDTAYSYTDHFENWIDNIMDFYFEKNHNPAVVAVFTSFNDDWFVFAKNGIDKGIYILAAMIFLIEHKEVNSEIAKQAYNVIKDLKQPKFQKLFPKEDVILLNKDIRRVSDYLKSHPELLK